MGRMSQLPAVIDTKSALERYSNGESIRDIAKSMGCSHVALYNRLLVECPEEWKALASSNALSDLDEAEHDLKTAPDMLTVTRARGWADIQRWKLERLLRRYFGQDQAVTAQAVQININLRRTAETEESS
jgi:hypothetical protein